MNYKIKIMSILNKRFSGGAKELVKGVGGVLDNLTTTKEEKHEAQRKIQKLVSDYETKMEQNITDRWKADMNSDSWLSKNVRRGFCFRGKRCWCYSKLR